MKYILVSLFLIGCSTTSYKPISSYEVSIIPNDCLNRKEILVWLDKQLGVAKGDDANAIKYKMWEIRAICQRV